MCGGMPPPYWKGRKKGDKAHCDVIFDRLVVSGYNHGRPLSLEVNEATLEYFPLDKDDRRTTDKALPIVYTTSKGRYLYKLVGEEEAEKFRATYAQPIPPTLVGARERASAQGTDDNASSSSEGEDDDDDDVDVEGKNEWLDGDDSSTDGLHGA